MLTVFPDSDCVPNPPPSCAFPPQKNRLLAGKISLVPGAEEQVTSQARGRGHYSAMMIRPNRLAYSGPGFRSEQRGKFGRLFFGKEGISVSDSAARLWIGESWKNRSTTDWTQVNILPSLLLLTKIRLSSYTLKIKTIKCWRCLSLCCV